MKDSITPATKVYNWNLISKALESAGIPLEEDLKSLIIAGDLQIIVETLQQIYNAVTTTKNASEPISQQISERKSKEVKDIESKIQNVTDRGC